MFFVNASFIERLRIGAWFGFVCLGSGWVVGFVVASLFGWVLGASVGLALRAGWRCARAQGASFVLEVS